LQEASLYLLDLLARLAKFSPAHRKVVCEELTALNQKSGTPERLDSLISSGRGRFLLDDTVLADSDHFKEVLGARFAAHYSALAEFYLRRDPNADYFSMFSLAFQICATPVIALHLVSKSDFVLTLLQTLQAAAASPPRDVSRYYTIMTHLSSLLSDAGVQRALVEDPKTLTRTAFFGLGLNFASLSPIAPSKSFPVFVTCLRLLELSSQPRFIFFHFHIHFVSFPHSFTVRLKSNLPVRQHKRGLNFTLERDPLPSLSCWFASGKTPHFLLRNSSASPTFSLP